MTLRLVDGQLVDDGGEPVTSPVMDEVPPVDEPEYPTCETCNQVNYEWQPGQRGRKPKYHRDCRPITPNRGGGRRGNSSDAQLRHSLEKRYVTLSQTLALLRPQYAMLVMAKTEDAVNAHMEYAANNPKYRKILEKSLEKTALAELVSVHAAMFGPIFVGESMRSAAQKAASGNARGRQNPNRQTSRPAQTPPQAPQQPQPQPQQAPQPQPQQSNVHPIRPEPQLVEDDWDIEDAEIVEDYPAEETVEDAGRAPETVNAGAMPGMPG